MIMKETTGDDGRQVPQPPSVVMAFPLLPPRPDPTLSPAEKDMVARYVVNVLARALEIPRDIILWGSVNVSSAGFSISVVLPHRVRHMAQPLVEQIHDPHSIWESLFRGMVQKEGWRFIVPKTDKKESGATRGGYALRDYAR